MAEGAIGDLVCGQCAIVHQHVPSASQLTGIGKANDMACHLGNGLHVLDACAAHAFQNQIRSWGWVVHLLRQDKGVKRWIGIQPIRLKAI